MKAPKLGTVTITVYLTIHLVFVFSCTDSDFCCFLLWTEHHGPPSGTNSARQSPALQHRSMGQAQTNHIPGDRCGYSQVLGFFSSPCFSLFLSQVLVHKPDNQVEPAVQFFPTVLHPRLSPPPPLPSPSQAQHKDPVSLIPATDCASLENHFSREGRAPPELVFLHCLRLSENSYIYLSCY